MYNDCYSGNQNMQFGQTVHPNATASLSIVHGKEVAMSYPSMIGMASYFLDDSQPYLYKKRLDNNGNVVEFRKFRLEEEIDKPPVQIDPNNFVTKDDLNGLYQAIADLKSSIATQKPIPNQFKVKKESNHESSPRQ